MTGMEVTRRTLTTDVGIGGNRTFRIGLSLDWDGTPAFLTITPGWFSGGEFEANRNECLTMPGEAIGPLRAALAELVIRAAGAAGTGAAATE